MAPWTKVVADPLGLAGFALFLLFGLIAKITSKSERQWISRTAVGAAVITLVSCLALAFVKQTRATPQAEGKMITAAPASLQQNKEVLQSTSGPGSPAIQGVQGSVTVTVDQSSGQASATKTKVDQSSATKAK